MKTKKEFIKVNKKIILQTVYGDLILVKGDEYYYKDGELIIRKVKEKDIKGDNDA